MGVDLRIPMPRQGWRIFFGEVGVIVLGVLLALGAQQVVQDWQMRGEVSTFRQTIDHEIALNLYIYDVRTNQTSCVTKQLSELDSWLDLARNGAAVPPLRTQHPLSFSVYRSAWDNRNANVFAHLPDETRQKYAEFYDELANNAKQIGVETETWRALYAYAEPGPLSLEDRRKIRSTLGIARQLNGIVDSNVEFSRKIAKALGVRKIAPDGFLAEFGTDLDECASVIAKNQ
jgi:hypothetical protein